MKIRRVDPRDTVWEQDHARYRVYFWDVPRLTAHEFEVAEESDADAVLAWTREHAAQHGWNYTVYIVIQDNDGPGLIRLAGVLGDPFTSGV
ncbi:hypothetical protein ACIQRS_28595 [Streptomyces termitum]|uniref:Uncharacterized protein n=1 Tax=Streptomyces termitum TaxID=67368 RepID=A0A918T9G3_9ACTN|nr:hypothetical protein [Streptomyces termitum]GHB03847.1 hypothetical protein GCM10010305_53730 [Streptomyces termitum]